MKPERHHIQLSPLARARLRCERGETTAILVPYNGALVADEIEVDGESVSGSIDPSQYDTLPSDHYYLSIPMSSESGKELIAGEPLTTTAIAAWLFSSVDDLLKHRSDRKAESGVTNIDELIVRFDLDGVMEASPGRHTVYALQSVGIVGVVPASGAGEPLRMEPYVNTSAAEPRSDG